MRAIVVYLHWWMRSQMPPITRRIILCGRRGSYFLLYCYFKLFNSVRGIACIPLIFGGPKGISHMGSSSWDQAGQLMSPRNKIKWPGNSSLKWRVVWAVVPPFWNQTFWMLCFIQFRTLEGLQHLHEFTVSVVIFFSSKSTASMCYNLM